MARVLQFCASIVTIMKQISFLFALLFSGALYSQGVSLKAGDPLPPVTLRIINSPVKTLNLLAEGGRKFYILNFWGTWCAPCIPEMEHLAELQKLNSGKLQILAVSEEPLMRLENYLKKRPTPVWLASDITALLYRLFNLSAVGFSALVDRDRKVVAVVKTSSIDQPMLDALYRGDAIRSTAVLNEAPVVVQGDLFGVDTTMLANFTVRGYMVGQEQGGRIYGGKGVFGGRRISYINTGITTLYKAAYGITSQKQVFYEVEEKSVNNYEDKSTRYCVDLLVSPAGKDSLYSLFRQRLNSVLPVKARIEYREMPVYVMVDNGFKGSPSTAAFTYSFSGKGFEGKGVTFKLFADAYLSNELDLPVVDETGLAGKVDITTNMDMRTLENVIKSVEELGLKLKREIRRLKVLVLY